jgi:hypothetical protein
LRKNALLTRARHAQCLRPNFALAPSWFARLLVLVCWILDNCMRMRSLDAAKMFFSRLCDRTEGGWKLHMNMRHLLFFWQKRPSTPMTKRTRVDRVMLRNSEYIIVVHVIDLVGKERKRQRSRPATDGVLWPLQ